MLMPRIIPCLLLDDGGFVKTTKFKNPDYVGDPVNVINLFNRFEVDEIVVLDISATVQGRKPDFSLIEDLASECWVPLSYGGGLSSIEDIQRIFSMGVEKIVLNSAAYLQPELIKETVDIYGSQAIVASIDVGTGLLGGTSVYIRSGGKKVAVDPVEYAKRLEQQGVGEIFLNAIHRDGTWRGFDLDLVERIAGSVSVPVIACGGAGSRDDLKGPLSRGASAVAAGSIFVYKGPEKGVLVNYPLRAEVEEILKVVEKT